MIEFRLPFPPSVNGMYFNTRKSRASTPEYKAWQEQALWELKAQKVKPFPSRAHVTIDLDESRRGDADNRAKPVLDILKTGCVLINDSKKHVKRVSIGWEPITGCRVRLEAA